MVENHKLFEILMNKLRGIENDFLESFTNKFHPQPTNLNKLIPCKLLFAQVQSFCRVFYSTLNVGNCHLTMLTIQHFTNHNNSIHFLLLFQQHLNFFIKRWQHPLIRITDSAVSIWWIQGKHGRSNQSQKCLRNHQEVANVKEANYKCLLFNQCELVNCSSKLFQSIDCRGLMVVLLSSGSPQKVPTLEKRNRFH